MSDSLAKSLPRLWPIRLGMVGGLLGLSLVAVLLILVSRGGISSPVMADADSKLSESRLLVETVEAVEIPSYQVSRSFVGRIEPRRRSDLGFDRSGELVEVRVDEGDSVASGQVVARIDTRELQAQRRELVAQLSQAEVMLEEMIEGPRSERIAAARAELDRWTAERDLRRITAQRTRQLIEQGVISGQQWDEDRLAVAVAEAQMRSAEALLDELLEGTRAEQIAAQRAQVQQLSSQIATLDVRLEKSELLAPYAGTVASRYVDEGHVIAVGQPVLQILETGDLEARIGVGGDLIEQIYVGQSHRLLIGGQGGQPCSAIVRAIRPDRTMRTRTVTVLLALVEAEGMRLHDGDLATLTLASHQDVSGYWLPLDALTESIRGLWGCYVIQADESSSNREDRIVARRVLERLHQTDHQVFVRGELQTGDRVVASGVHRLVPGQKVRVAIDRLVEESLKVSSADERPDTGAEEAMAAEGIR